MKVISCAAARAAGLGTYFTGKPCKRGHVAARYVKLRYCVQCQRERFKKWHCENRERQNAKSRAYYQANKIARIQYAKANRHISRKACAKWSRNNLEKIRVIHHRRRARKKAAGGSYTVEQAAEIFRLQRGRCAYCKTKLDGEKHLDHIIPIALGGRNDRQNLQWLCARCNHSKSDRDPLDFARQLGALL